MLEVGFSQYSPNHKEAVRLYEEAVNYGNKDALFNLGLAYQNGIHYKIDEMKAIDLFKEAASQGHSNSIDYLIKLGIIEDKHQFQAQNQPNQYGLEEESEEEESEEEENENDTFARARTVSKK
mmetsp:Transcript_8730/g.8275  ORF Transcript_8730/g.8275 Transcript_8730/m.8275 type:complete len:123 (+) Transcript_8730:1613-1981(+)